MWKSRGAPDWQPANYDKFPWHGAAEDRARAVLQRGRGALGHGLGIERVIENVRRLGVGAPAAAVCVDALGAVELSPLEVAQMYQTIASGGFRSPLRASAK